MSVEILSHFGDDLMIVNVARVSYGKEVEEFTGKDAKLLNYLVKHGHTSPFRHPQIQFRITCPIYVERQLFKHQVGWSANSISGRYVDFSDSYYEIQQFRYQSTSSKQGSAGDLEFQKNQDAIRIQNTTIALCKNAYEELLKLGISKEQCRSVLPLSLNTTFIWTGSLLGILHLFNLRLKPDAQKETQDVVAQMLELVHNIEGNPFKYTLEAFGYEPKVEEVEEVIPNPIWRVRCKKGFVWNNRPTVSIRTHEYKKALEGYYIEILSMETGQTLLLSPEEVISGYVSKSKMFGEGDNQYQLFNYYID